MAIMPPNIAVLISGNGSNLQAIIDASLECSDFNISLVISNKSDAYGLVRAEQAKIPTTIVPHNRFENREQFEQTLICALKKVNPSFIVLAGFMRILSPHFVKSFAGKIINIHPSLLPRHPGLNTHEKVITHQESEHGVSIHVVTNQLDGGPIIAQAQFRVPPTANAAQLQQRCHHIEHQMYPTIIRWLCQGRLQIEKSTVLYDQQPLPAAGLDFTKNISESDL